MRIFPLLIAGLPAVLVGQQGQIVKLTLVPHGGMPVIGYYMPARIALSQTKPAGVHVAPPGLVSPWYGELSFGGKTVEIIVDAPAGKPSRLFVDSNGDGDLTNDPAPVWKPMEQKGVASGNFMGSATITLAKGETLSLGMYKFDPADPRRAQFKNTLFYFRDYARKGVATLDGKTYPIVLDDARTLGTLDKENLTLLIDRHGAGQYGALGQSFPAGKPFNLDHTTYEIADIAPDGSSIRIVPSKIQVPVTELPPSADSFAVGKSSIPFEAVTTGGQKVSFPGTYKGKVVMLDFWATWCGPCVGELPNVKKAYTQYHPKGFEILSISLDQKGDGPKLAAFTAENHMPWDQVYDGGFWNARVAKMYGVQAIPFVILVDGDTGKILADESTLRGPQISDTIAKALKTKGL